MSETKVLEANEYAGLCLAAASKISEGQDLRRLNSPRRLAKTRRTGSLLWTVLLSCWVCAPAGASASAFDEPTSEPPPPASGTASGIEGGDDASEASSAEIPTTDERTGETSGLTWDWSSISIRAYGYVQVQYQNSQLSKDEILQGGRLLNDDRFALRRGRLGVVADWSFGQVTLEVDGNNARGPYFGVRRGEATFFLPSDKGGVPWVGITVGLTDIPFGHELAMRQEDIPFLERTTASLSFFPGPPDTGAKLFGGVGPLRWVFAVLGGTPLDDRAGGIALDPAAAVELVGRIGAESNFGGDFELGGGLSFLHGKGFSEGTQATKSRIDWQDFNGNGVFDGGELGA